MPEADTEIVKEAKKDMETENETTVMGKLALSHERGWWC